MDRDQIVDLAVGHRRQVADLAESVGVGLGLEDLDRVADQPRDLAGAIEVADDPAGGAGGAGADPVLLEHEHVPSALGQALGGREPKHPAADDDVFGVLGA